MLVLLYLRSFRILMRPRISITVTVAKAIKIQVVIEVYFRYSAVVKIAVSVNNKRIVCFLKKICSFSVKGLFLSSIGANIKIRIKAVTIPKQQILWLVGKNRIANSIAVIRITEKK